MSHGRRVAPLDRHFIVTAFVFPKNETNAHRRLALRLGIQWMVRRFVESGAQECQADPRIKQRSRSRRPLKSYSFLRCGAERSCHGPHGTKYEEGRGDAVFARTARSWYRRQASRLPAAGGACMHGMLAHHTVLTCVLASCARRRWKGNGAHIQWNSMTIHVVGSCIG